MPWQPGHRRTAARFDADLDEYRTVMDEVRSGRLKLLYVAPERFVNERFCEVIQRTAISLFAVDEAHCISEWGHNFRPDYLRLAQFFPALPGRAGAGAHRHRHAAGAGRHLPLLPH